MVLPCAALCALLTANVIWYVPADNEWHTNSVAALAALFTPDHGDPGDGDAPLLSHDFYEVDDVVDFMNESYLAWAGAADDEAGAYFYPAGPDGVREQPAMRTTLKESGSTATRELTCTLYCDPGRCNPFGPFVSYAHGRHNASAAEGAAEREEEEGWAATPRRSGRASRRRLPYGGVGGTRLYCSVSSVRFAASRRPVARAVPLPDHEEGGQPAAQAGDAVGAEGGQLRVPVVPYMWGGQPDVPVAARVSAARGRRGAASARRDLRSGHRS
eukprot:gene7133-24459_t